MTKSRPTASRLYFLGLLSAAAFGQTFFGSVVGTVTDPSGAAIPHLEKAQANDLLGVALLETGRTREAVDALEAALRQRPVDADLLYYLGAAHSRLAQQAVERLRAAQPESPRVQQILGEARAAEGNREAAERHFRAALAARPDLPGAHLALGDLCMEAGDYQRAEAEFRAEARAAPGSAAAAYKLGLALAHLGRTEESITALARANELRAEMPETLLALGKALTASGRAAEAEKYLLAVVRLEPESELAATAHYQLSRVYRALGRASEAEREATLFQRMRKPRE